MVISLSQQQWRLIRRWMIATLIGPIVTTVLVLGMVYATTSVNLSSKSVVTGQILHFISAKKTKSTILERKNRRIPDKPKLSQPVTRVADPLPASRSRVIPADELLLPLSDLQAISTLSHDEMFLGVPDFQSAPLALNGEVTPLLRVEPVYPQRALVDGVEGYVLLEFDVTVDGIVDNVNVIEARPRRVFERAAKAAVRKWKYRPLVVDGKTMKQESLRVKIEFKLDAAG